MDPFKKPEGISWDAASVQLPEMPMLPPGEDAMSATISAVLPTLAAPLMANVAALQTKEGMFSGKLVSAQAAYQNADDSGGQSVGQLTSMLGQLGQTGGQAASQAGQGGQGGGMFGQMMQQAMQAAQSFGGQAGGPQGGGGQPAAGTPGQPAAAPAGQQSAGPAPAAPPRESDAAADEAREHEQKREAEQRPLLQHAEGAGPAEERPSPGPAPVTPPQPATDAEVEDLARRML
jgi:hypothetical protein